MVSKDYVERILDVESDWDLETEGNAVEGPVDCVNRDEVVQALKEVTTEKPLDLQNYY